MDMVQVESSMISAVGYDSAAQELEVVFTSGKTWRYSGVPADVYADLLAADSKGQFMRDSVIGVYPERRLTQRRRPRV